MKLIYFFIIYKKYSEFLTIILDLGPTLSNINVSAVRYNTDF